MKKIIYFLIALLVMAFFSVGKAHAQEEEMTPTPTPEIIISPTPTPTIPQIILLPPTPTPKEEKDIKQRIISFVPAWKKFKYKEIIEKISNEYKLDPQLIYATIMTESEGNEYAYRYEPHINDASLCMGQILVGTARNLGFEGNPMDMYKPDICIDLIGKYHRNMLDTYGDLTPYQLTAAYNTGSPWKRPYPGHMSRFSEWYNETIEDQS